MNRRTLKIENCCAPPVPKPQPSKKAGPSTFTLPGSAVLVCVPTYQHLLSGKRGGVWRVVFKTVSGQASGWDRVWTCFIEFFRSEKSQNESFPNFSNSRPEFCPEFCSEFSPNFSRTFRASFRGRRRPEKTHQKSPPFFNAKLPGKHEKNIHKILLESKQSKNFGGLPKHMS